MAKHATGVSGVYPGRVEWAVRWGEAGTPVKIRQYNDEAEARSMYEFLLGRYEALGRTDKPELLAARIHWVVQQ